MFFSKFKNINYDEFFMKDLSVAFVIKPEIKNNKDLFFYYEIAEYERPETVAFDFYGLTTYNFVIMLMNDIVDPFWDWPLDKYELQAYVEELYGEPTQTSGRYDKVTDVNELGEPIAPFRNAGFFAVRFYEKDGIQYQYAPGTGHDQFLAGDKSTDGALFGEAPLGARAVSHIEYEERINDDKRKIKILYPELIPKLQKELDIILNG